MQMNLETFLDYIWGQILELPKVTIGSSAGHECLALVHLAVLDTSLSVKN